MRTQPLSSRLLHPSLGYSGVLELMGAWVGVGGWSEAVKAQCSRGVRGREPAGLPSVKENDKSEISGKRER